MTPQNIKIELNIKENDYNTKKIITKKRENIKKFKIDPILFFRGFHNPLKNQNFLFSEEKWNKIHWLLTLFYAI